MLQLQQTIFPLEKFDSKRFENSTKLFNFVWNRQIWFLSAKHKRKNNKHYTL